MLRALCSVVALVALTSCAHEDDARAAVDLPPAEEFARQALGAIDAAPTCAKLAEGWHEYLEPVTRAAVDELVPCTRRVLAARHDVEAVWPYDEALSLDLTVGLPRSDVHVVQLAAVARREVDSFPLGDLLDDGWFVVTDEGRRWLMHPAIVALEQCLAVQDECSMAG